MMTGADIQQHLEGYMLPISVQDETHRFQIAVTVKTISPKNALLLKAPYLKMMISPSVFRIDDTEQRSYFDC